MLTTSRSLPEQGCAIDFAVANQASEGCTLGLEALAGTIRAAGLRFAVCAPGEPWAFNGNGEWEFLAAQANGVVLSGRQTKSIVNNLIDLFQNRENPLLGFLQGTGKISNFRRDVVSDSGVGRQQDVFSVVRREFVRVGRQKGNLG